MKITVGIQPLAKRRWTGIKARCAGQIDSLVELLQGSLSKSVMEIVTRKGEGLFPSPREISLSCSCPDWATMCKHVAATLYGVGTRLDDAPALLFTLRGVDPAEMVEAAVDQPLAAGRSRRSRVLKSDELSSVFGIDIDVGIGPDMGATSGGDVSAPGTRGRRAVRRGKKTDRRSKAVKKPAAKKSVTKKKTATKKTSTKKKKSATPKKVTAKRASRKTKRRAKKKTSAKSATPEKKTTTEKSAPKKPSRRTGPRTPAKKQASR